MDEKDYHRMYEEQHRRVASWSGLKPCWRDLREAITREFFVLSLLDDEDDDDDDVDDDNSLY